MLPVVRAQLLRFRRASSKTSLIQLSENQGRQGVSRRALGPSKLDCMHEVSGFDLEESAEAHP